MALAGVGDLFLGLTSTPTREYVAEYVKRTAPQRVFMPCAGRFFTMSAVAKLGYPTDQIYASDISLFSSLIGYLADPSKQVADLGVHLPAGEPYASFVSDTKSEVELVAGLFLCMYYVSNPPKNAYLASVCRELRRNWPQRRAGLAEKLQNLVDVIHGIHYEIQDMRDVLKAYQATGTERDFLLVFPPFYAGGYTKMFDLVDNLMPWRSPHITEFAPEETETLFTPFTDHPATLFLGTRFPEKAPQGWQSVFASVVSADRIDYIYSNQLAEFRYAAAKIPEGTVRHYEIYGDQEITQDSVLDVVEVNNHTCLYYRDLFVHRLGTVSAEAYFLLLVDGRVITAFGLHSGILRGGTTKDMLIVFGVSKSSQRYARLGKLFELAVSTTDFKERMLNSNIFRQLRLFEIEGVRTSALTLNPNAALYRGVMKRVSKEQQKNGSYKIVFRTNWRKEVWKDTLKRWLKFHSRYTPKDKEDGEDAGPGQPVGAMESSAG